MHVGIDIGRNNLSGERNKGVEQKRRTSGQLNIRWS